MLTTEKCSASAYADRRASMSSAYIKQAICIYVIVPTFQFTCLSEHRFHAIWSRIVTSNRLIIANKFQGKLSYMCSFVHPSTGMICN